MRPVQLSTCISLLVRQDEVQLFGLVSSPYTVVSLSPFTGKVQTFLRMANIPHKFAEGLYVLSYAHSVSREADS
jgi:hypothetical protein